MRLEGHDPSLKWNWDCSQIVCLCEYPSCLILFEALLLSMLLLHLQLNSGWMWDRGHLQICWVYNETVQEIFSWHQVWSYESTYVWKKKTKMKWYKMQSCPRHRAPWSTGALQSLLFGCFIKLQWAWRVLARPKCLERLHKAILLQGALQSCLCFKGPHKAPVCWGTLWSP